MVVSAKDYIKHTKFQNVEIFFTGFALKEREIYVCTCKIYAQQL